ncbi:hypothetical protein A2125_00470 [Candidatus Woesebacteria bacterium GWB1_43_5]|uniref:Pseudouridine synthase n=1 Tax=Candidatus Woesebacteria bacterium GWB1_43_5 TaxID=1802474 RepID=A0A1F7WSB5_9BACT|nr:MAG: hypothetical protein A2125_00470 [Candidatus Woesebacteria bacterium GWB1_43_5]
MEPRLIFQDEHMLVLDKPPGWVVNEADTTKNFLTIQKWLQENFDYEISKDKQLRSGIVHRLDKETSGLLLVAKTHGAFENLQKQFKERVVEKTYIALAHGEVVEKSGEISATVGRLKWNRRKFGVVPGGREALTRYRIISNYPASPSGRQMPISNEKYSLLELYPKTGRTHQIRVHLKYLGHPIVSDKTYVGRKTWRRDTKWCPRLFLHASEISFIHPGTGKKISFESKLSEDLQRALTMLE